MSNENVSKHYGIGYRIFTGILTLLIVLGNVYVIFYESWRPSGYYGYIGVMILCTIILVNVGCHIAITGNRPGYMQPGKNDEKSNNE